MPLPDRSTLIPFRCEGVIDSYTGRVEVHRVECESLPEMESVIRIRLQSMRRWSLTAKKVRIWLWLIVLSTFLAALYGALHNQISYTIGPEYFTKIKFRQIGIDENTFGGPRQGAAFVGVVSSWWVGTFVAFVLGFFGLIHLERDMFRRTFRALLLVLGIAIVFGLIGLGVGELLASNLDWAPPEKRALTDPQGVLTTWVMHVGSYVGGLLGLLIGIFDVRRIAYRTSGGETKSEPRQ